MTKKRLTKAQAIAKKAAQQKEESARKKLLAALAPRSNKEISLHAIPTYEYDDPSQARTIASANAPARTKKPKPVNYEDNPELAEREAKAQKEKDHKRKRLAPAYNKGPVMYITDDTNPAELGRKL